MKPTILTRIRLPFELITRLDALGAEVRKIIRRRIPRARLIRALIRLALESALAPEIASATKADPVRQGREKRRPA